MSRLGKAVRWRWAAGVLCCLWAGGPTGPADAAPPRCQTAAELERALQGSVRDVVWSAGTPVRQALMTLGEMQGIAIMLDRRIDPESGIELSLRDVTVMDVVAQVAAQCDAAPRWLDAVVYVGPRAATAGLMAAAAQRRREAQSLPRARATRLTARRVWSWDELAAPRMLLEELAREAQITWDDIDRVPHDLWPAMDLPPLTWTDRATLVLAGFDLTFELGDRGGRARLVELPVPTRVVGRYLAQLPPAERAALARLFPEAVVEEAAGSVMLEDVPEEQTRLQQWLRQATAPRPRPRGADKTVMTLRVTQQPVGAILRAITERLGVAFEMEGTLDEHLQTRVSVDVHDATLDALLSATLEPAGLTFRRRGDVIVIAAPQ